MCSSRIVNVSIASYSATHQEAFMSGPRRKDLLSKIPVTTTHNASDVWSFLNTLQKKIVKYSDNHLASSDFHFRFFALVITLAIKQCFQAFPDEMKNIRAAFVSMFSSLRRR